MEIMKLVKTLYFNDENEIYDSFEEAKENSIYPDYASFIKKQKVKVYENNELDSSDFVCGDNFEYYVYSMKGDFIIALDDLTGYFEPIKEE